jgi:glutaredoxin 2
MSHPKLVLYIGEGCPFCAKVTDYLKQHPMDIELKEVWHNPQAEAELLALSGKKQVPCLKMDADFMHESLDIIEKLKSFA